MERNLLTWLHNSTLATMTKRYARLFLSALALAGVQYVHADRVYIMNSTGYNSADPELITAIQSLGHTVVESAMGATTLPANFVSACEDPVNGFHWLCFYGNQDRSSLNAQVQVFLANGGKVLLQYEVSCCEVASQAAATMVSAYTGLNITPNAEPFIAISGTANVVGWEASSPEDCINIQGNAYKCMDGVPPGNRLVATGNLNGSTPDYTVCTNFGFIFQPAQLPGNSGGIVGFGDINLYYLSAGEPPNSGGTNAVDMNVVELIFANETSNCSLLPSGCLSNGLLPVPQQLVQGLYPNPANDRLTVEFLNSGTEELMIMDGLGRTVLSERAVGALRIDLNTSALAPGVYHLVAVAAGHRQRSTFVIAR